MASRDLNLIITVIGHDRASGALGRVSNMAGILNVGLGTLLADGLQATSAAMFELGRLGFEIAGDYQQHFNVLEGVTDATSDQMERARRIAKELGSDLTLPATSAADASRAMLALARGGLDVEQAMAAAGATLRLATIAEIDEARAAEIAAQALTSFGLAGEKTAFIVDLLAASADASTAEIEDVADSFQMAANVFSSFQGPVVGAEQAVKDLMIATTLLAKAGIKGSDAGTSLKQMLLQLTGPSGVAKDAMRGLMFSAQGAAISMETMDAIIGGKAKARTEALQQIAAANPDIAAMGDIAYDASGKMRPLQEIIALVAAGTKNLNDEQRNQALTTIFGADATRAILALLRAGPEAWDATSAAISEQGAAMDRTNRMTQGLKGAWDALKSAFMETAPLALAEPLLEPIERMARRVAGAVNDLAPDIEAFSRNYIAPAIDSVMDFAEAFAAAPDKIAFLGQKIAELDIPGLLGGLVDTGAKWIEEQAPAWGDAIINGIKLIAPRTSEALDPIATNALTWMEDQKPELEKRGNTWKESFFKWIGEAGGELAVALGDLLGSLMTWVYDHREDLSRQFAWWTLELIKWFGIGFWPAVGSALVELGKVVWEDLKKKWEEAFSEGSLGEALVKGIGKGVADNLPGLVKGIWEHIWQQATNPFAVPSALWDAAKAAGVDTVFPEPPGFASGVRGFGGGMAIVGERGPELVSLPGGSGVYSAAETRAAGAGGGGVVWTGNMIIQGAQDPAATARAVRDELIRIGKRNNGLAVFGGYA